MSRRVNPLTRTDVYKLGHMCQYRPGTEFVYSYLQARCPQRTPYKDPDHESFDQVVFYGLQYYLKEYLSQPLEPWMAEDFFETYRQVLDQEPSEDVKQKIRGLCELGYWPVHIKAVPEGTVLPVKNVLLTICNTLPEYYWCVGFIESLLLKVWYPITVASCSFQYRQLVDRLYDETVDEDLHFLKDFACHDFGFRSDSSEEGAALSGVAHQLSFVGSDTLPSLAFARDYYNATPGEVMKSVPASEHSVMCSFGREDELASFNHLLDLYPTGIVSIVSDTYDIYNVLTDFMVRLKDRILSRDGKVVIRPDSGNPEHIICGNPDAPFGSPEYLGAVRLLDRVFGSSFNSKGYKVLNPKIGLIYGDGMYYARYKRTLNKLKDMGYAASNLVIGVGGILRNHSRDTLGFALKATCVKNNGEYIEIEKSPVTDLGKKSHKGLLRLDRVGDDWVTTDQVAPDVESGGELVSVFRNGKLLIEHHFSDIRSRVQESSRADTKCLTS